MHLLDVSGFFRIHNMINKLLATILAFTLCNNANSKCKADLFADKVNISIWINDIFFESNFTITENQLVYSRKYCNVEKQKSNNNGKIRKIVLDNDSAKTCIEYARNLFFEHNRHLVRSTKSEEKSYDTPIIKITYYKGKDIIQKKCFLYSEKLAEYDEQFTFMYQFFNSVINKENKIVGYKESEFFWLEYDNIDIYRQAEINRKTQEVFSNDSYGTTLIFNKLAKYKEELNKKYNKKRFNSAKRIKHKIQKTRKKNLKKQKRYYNRNIKNLSPTTSV